MCAVFIAHTIHTHDIRALTPSMPTLPVLIFPDYMPTPATPTSTTPEPTPTVTKGYHNGFTILKNGRLQAWGRNNFGLCGNGRAMENNAIHEAEAEDSCHVRDRTVRSSPPG